VKEVLAMKQLMVVMLVLFLAAPAFGAEMKAFKMRDDFGAAPLSDCALQYYYYIPCPTYNWFAYFSGCGINEGIGAWFQVGDISMGGHAACDPVNCHALEQFRILDFSGYGTVYPGLFTIRFDIYCCDEDGCPIGPPLWTSGPWETHWAWNYIPVDPPLSICECSVDPGPPPSGPRILIISTSIGTLCTYPAWGFDYIGRAVEQGCEMIDIGGRPALYPRPFVSYYPTIHSGWYGSNFQYCPPLWLCGDHDDIPGCTQFGFMELAWTIYLSCSGPTAAEPSTWGNIKAMYR
jgi:hypothetical protein